MLGRLRRVRNWLIAGVVVVVILAVGGPFVYIHFIEGPAPAKLVLPKSTGSASSGGNAASGTAIDLSKLDGAWNVGQRSVAGYRVGEVLIGQNSTAVGRTDEVWGSLSIAGGSVTKATFTVNMASVVSDQSERNAQFDGRIMDVSTYPTAKFVLSAPISLGSTVAGGSKQYKATGTLAMHGVTKPVSFTVSVEVTSGGTGAYVLADIPILFANWDISNPSVAGFVTTKSTGTLEVLLHLVRGAGNPVYSGSSSSSNSGGFGGGPVTVPSTTVPPLTVPAG